MTDFRVGAYGYFLKDPDPVQTELENKSVQKICNLSIWISKVICNFHLYAESVGSGAIEHSIAYTSCVKVYDKNKSRRISHDVDTVADR